MAMDELPKGFDVVREIRPSADLNAVRIISSSGKSLMVKLNLSFLWESDFSRSTSRKAKHVYV